jgi:hypothetical protein
MLRVNLRKGVLAPRAVLVESLPFDYAQGKKAHASTGDSSSDRIRHRQKA